MRLVGRVRLLVGLVVGRAVRLLVDPVGTRLEHHWVYHRART
jgi:hypothetical protein